MKQELEIEFKNQLTKNEYQSILQKDFINELTSIRVKQVNHYFDTTEKLLKKNQSAVRIRITNTKSELTFKIPSQDFLMEKTFALKEEQVNSILHNKQFSLSGVTKQTIDLGIFGITNQTIFHHFNSFETLRYEKQVGDNLIVLDQTTFQNGVVDYELEVESLDPMEGQKFFESFLDTYSIPIRATLPKIARAESNR